MVLNKPAKAAKPSREVLKRSETLTKKKAIGKFVLLAIFVAILLSGIFYLLYCRSLTINSISVQGNNIVSTEEITAYVDRSLDDRYWLVFPYRSIFLYPKATLEAGLLKEFPRLSDSRVAMDNWDSLIVDVKERDFSVVWCGEGEQTINSDCYFADDNGFIFAPAPYFSDSVFIELSGLLPDSPIGQAPLPQNDYSSIVKFATFLPKIFTQNSNNNYRLSKIEILDKDNYSALIAVPGAGTSTDAVAYWKIFFNNESSADAVAANLFSVLTSLPFKKDFLDNHGRLDYIDLRYNQKVYYKFK